MQRPLRALRDVSLSPAYAAKVDERLIEVLPELTTTERASRVDAVLDYMRFCAENPGQWFAPSRAVDDVWHEMLTFTRDYRTLCERLGTTFIDHEPIAGVPGERPSVASTIDLMRAQGFDAPSELWPREDAARCCGGCATSRHL